MRTCSFSATAVLEVMVVVIWAQFRCLQAPTRLPYVPFHHDLEANPRPLLVALFTSTSFDNIIYLRTNWPNISLTDLLSSTFVIDCMSQHA